MEIQNKLDTGQPIKAKDVLEDAKTIVSGD